MIREQVREYWVIRSGTIKGLGKFLDGGGFWRDERRCAYQFKTKKLAKAGYSGSLYFRPVRVCVYKKFPAPSVDEVTGWIVDLIDKRSNRALDKDYSSVELIAIRTELNGLVEDLEKKVHVK